MAATHIRPRLWPGEGWRPAPRTAWRSAGRTSLRVWRSHWRRRPDSGFIPCPWPRKHQGFLLWRPSPWGAPLLSRGWSCGRRDRGQQGLRGWWPASNRVGSAGGSAWPPASSCLPALDRARSAVAGPVCAGAAASGNITSPCLPHPRVARLPGPPAPASPQARPLPACPSRPGPRGWGCRAVLPRQHGEALSSQKAFTKCSLRTPRGLQPARGAPPPHAQGTAFKSPSWPHWPVARSEGPLTSATLPPTKA